MIRQPMLRRRMVGRLTIGLLGIATAFLMAPIAAAQPDVEAGGAITAAWEATGGDAGPLGPRSGDVYPVGDGFAQNFAAGKMFFTPATGAHFMQGAILEKYESLGGPAESDLGFPKIDEGPGRAAGSRNSTFSAADNPVIFWTPDTGARVVRGPINAAWDRLGGSSGVLGVPADDETYDGSVVAQRFTGGQLSYDSSTKTFTTVPPELAGQLGDLSVPDDPEAAINAARRAAGGPLGPLGAAEGEPYPIGDDGLGQDFVNGKIFYSPETGANVVTGQVLQKYESVGGPEGDLGFPTSSESDGGIAPSRMSTFAAEDDPVIFWTPDHGAVIVRGAMKAAWDKLGGATGELGAPVADQSQDGNVITQRFSNGALTYDTANQKFAAEPANLTSQLAGLEVPGQQAPAEDTPSTPQATAQDDEGTGLKWSWWWLAAITALIALVGVVGFVVLRNRNAGEDPFADSEPRYDDGYDSARGSFTGTADKSSLEASRDEDTLFGDRYAREGLSPVATATAPEPTAAATISEDVEPTPLSFWGVPSAPEESRDTGETWDDDSDRSADTQDPDAVDTTPTRVPTLSEIEEYDEPVVEADYDEPVVEADREPLMITAAGETGLERDFMTDTGRHARIDDEEPTPGGTAVHMPLDDPSAVPEGYPVKADTRSGLYWTPEDREYTDAPAELWFASEEMAITNGFVRSR
ncbi:LGFP repeat-containing protein [Mycolicibacterium vaccae]|uniref:LGFP repeat-containing protein n=1 Tax=Mycolicibacterium vaccae TaxID=1810 RepID=UPI003CFF9595